jgi:hypothetical protein
MKPNDRCFEVPQVPQTKAHKDCQFAGDPS